MRLRTLAIIAGGLLLTAISVPARADFMIDLMNVVPSSGGFLWNYSASIMASDRLSPLGSVPAPGFNPEDNTRSIKDYLTIYDFSGFTGRVVLPNPTQWSFVSYSFGSTPADVIPEDSPAFPNITIYRIPEAPPNCCGIIGPASFSFSIESRFGTRGIIGSFTGENTQNAPGQPNDGLGVSSVGDVESPFQVAQVPEPGTFLLVGAGLLGLGIWRRQAT